MSCDFDMADVAVSRAHRPIKIEVPLYEDEGDEEKNICIKTELEEYCSTRLNTLLNTSESQAKINVKEVPVEFETPVKNELDIGPTVVQPHYTGTVSPLRAIEANNSHPNKEQSSLPSTILCWKSRAKPSAQRMREYRRRKREAAGLYIEINSSTANANTDNGDDQQLSVVTPSAIFYWKRRPKSSTERSRECRKRKREAADSDHAKTSTTVENTVHYDNASVGERGLMSERAINISSHHRDVYSGSRKVKSAFKARRAVKTGAERIREYRSRIRSLKNAAAVRSMTNVDSTIIREASKQNSEGNQIDLHKDQRSLLYEALIRQTNQDEPETGENRRQSVAHVDVNEQYSPLLSGAPSNSTRRIQSSTQEVTMLRRLSKIAMTPAERARAYRERKRILKTTAKKSIIDSNNSHLVGPEEVISLGTSIACSRQGRELRELYELVVELPSISGSSNSMADTGSDNGQRPSAIDHQKKRAKSSTERSRDYYRRKKEAALMNVTKNAPVESKLENTWSAKQRLKEELERRHVSPSAPETETEDCSGGLGDCENKQTLAEDTKSDRTDTSLNNRMLIVDEGFIVQEFSNAVDPLSLNDAQSGHEPFINKDSSVLENPSHDLELLKERKERVENYLSKGETSVRHSKRMKKTARAQVCRRRAGKQKAYADNHSLDESGINESCSPTETRQDVQLDEETTSDNPNVSSQSAQESNDMTDHLLNPLGPSRMEATEQSHSRYDEDYKPPPLPPLCSRDMILIVSSADDRRHLMCKLCNARYRFMSTITKHLRTHTGEKPFSCDQCDARFKLSHHLAQHRRTHTGERPFSCDTCDMKFRQLAHLTIHKRTHTGEKPYRCKICDAQFRQSGSLTYHEQKHAEELRLHCCEVCGDKFKDLDSFTVHKRSHSVEQVDCGMYSVTLEQTRPLVGRKRPMKVFQVEEF